MTEAKDNPSGSMAYKSRLIIQCVAGIAVLCGCVGVGYGLHRLRQAVLAKPPIPAAPARVVIDWPNWMPPDVRGELATAANSAVKGRNVFDDNLSGDIYNALAKSTWIARIDALARCHDGTVRVQAAFRRPLALAESDEGACVVDADGFVLPMAPERARPAGLMLIRGVSTAAPPTGKQWRSPDLLDALRLLRMLEGKPYMGQIACIDLRNYSGQLKDPIEPRLRMLAQQGQARTDIRMERMAAEDGLDYCITPQRQIEKLDAYYYDNNCKLAGVHSFIDLRYDKLHVSLR